MKRKGNLADNFLCWGKPDISNRKKVTVSKAAKRIYWEESRVEQETVDNSVGLKEDSYSTLFPILTHHSNFSLHSNFNHFLNFVCSSRFLLGEA